ncbi:MAG TPA: carboxylating nicotinate-nucleotide diphosphorylase [bacterium]|nr:carboxylating nicotinate-nucleotide diphosphorylase [Myxococcales bacterium]OQA62262.1 MAG: putative nicotinate-nucleotide pyrophosphorylase (carboxylating) [bacterium ADurb.Bin270]HPW45143.1 carboxylating nicotinate-nucleotide diphosphorylase [bacterium]HQG13354.1 carboxylating nicotinate-nucleotide diphosphorylase [bacterium]HQH80200.1 carboxylating nicotinate-nucleotide diphosphorylase [bacterium]
MNNTDEIINIALKEDIGNGDITTEATISRDSMGFAKIIAKSDLILSGILVAGRVFEILDPETVFTPQKSDGEPCRAGETLASLSGRIQILLTGERTALNFLQHLSGIATATKHLVEMTSQYGIKILDTRKTTPGLRILEKDAVRHGGGTNHRMGLYDHFLIKNNHITAAGSLSKAVAAAKRNMIKGQKIEVEARDMDEVKEAIASGADIIMLDNMEPEQVKTAVTVIGGAANTEISGNMTEEKIVRYLDSGVDFISVGALTHSAKAADIHMLIKMN